MVGLAQRLGGDRVVLVTGAAAPTAAPNGHYTLAGRPIVLREGVVRLVDGTLAGSALGALQAFRYYAHFAGLQWLRLPER